MKIIHLAFVAFLLSGCSETIARNRCIDDNLQEQYPTLQHCIAHQMGVADAELDGVPVTDPYRYREVRRAGKKEHPYPGYHPNQEACPEGEVFCCQKRIAFGGEVINRCRCAKSCS